jgi:hypothetical protein
MIYCYPAARVALKKNCTLLDAMAHNYHLMVAGYEASFHQLYGLGLLSHYLQ